jgi:predicted nucleic acid-binding protein
VRAVLDANVVVRGVLGQAEEPARWVARLEDAEFVASVPDLLFPEVAQAFLGYLRSGDLSMSAAEERLDFVRALPLRVRATQDLVVNAVKVAASRQLSAYDACYAVLAEAEDALLVTGDRGLAAAATRAKFVDDGVRG